MVYQDCKVPQVMMVYLGLKVNRDDLGPPGTLGYLDKMVSQ
jgi:hypothetical protein